MVVLRIWASMFSHIKTGFFSLFSFLLCETSFFMSTWQDKQTHGLLCVRGRGVVDLGPWEGNDEMLIMMPDDSL